MAQNPEAPVLPFSISVLLEDEGEGLANPVLDPTLAPPSVGDRDAMAAALWDQVRLLTDQVRAM